MRSLATRSRRSPPRSYRSRTFPARMNDAARTSVSGIRRSFAFRPIAALQPADDPRHGPQARPALETGVGRGKAQVARDLRIRREQLLQRPSFVGGAERCALDDRVRGL